MPNKTNKAKKYNFVYKTTNIINGKYYIGARSTNKINDGYIGCGIRSQAYANAVKKFGLKSLFIDAVFKFGYENFKREILCFTDSKEDAFELEELIVDREFIDKSDNYNSSIGGGISKKYTTTISDEELIFADYMSGMTKLQINKKYGISSTIIWRIIKRRDRSNKVPNIEYYFNKRSNIEKWVREKGRYYIQEYCYQRMGWREISRNTPFHLKTFNFLENVNKNKKYCCILESGDIYFDTAKEISEYLNVHIFNSGFMGVINGRCSHYKGYKFRRSKPQDFAEIDYENIINCFLEKMWASLQDLKLKNRFIIKK